MNQSPSLIIAYLDKTVNEIMSYAGFMPNLGLYDGKIGVSLLLYHYSRFSRNEEVEAYAGFLLDEVFTGIQTQPIHLIPDIPNIAWTLCHLEELGFIEGNLSEVLEDIDSFLWSSEEETFDLYNIQKFTDIGIYITARINSSAGQNLWFERGIIWLKQVENFINKYGIPNVSTILSVFVFYRAIHKFGLKSLLGKYWVEKMSWFFKLAYLYISECQTDKYILHAFSILNILDFSDHPLSTVHLNPSLLNTNQFYLYRLLYGDFGSPNTLDDGIFSILKDQKRMGDLISLANPQNIGLKSYLGGWSWALLQHCISKGINYSCFLEYSDSLHK
jgi:hypothetical protein